MANKTKLPNCALNVDLKAKAHRVLWKAIAKRLLKKAKRCQQCGQAKPTVPHYADYAKFLEVEWLCGSCHKLTHYRLFRESQTQQHSNGNGHK